MTTVDALAAAERRTFDQYFDAATNYAALCADHGPDHIWHEQWREKYITARYTWQVALAALQEAIDPPPSGLDARSIAKVRQALKEQTT